MAELEQQLQQERRARVGAERWLEAELRSKEEMETLFCSMRDLALDKEKAKETESQSLRAAVDKLQATESTVLRYALELPGLRSTREPLAKEILLAPIALRQLLGLRHRRYTALSAWQTRMVLRAPCSPTLTI